uniref:uncharacterized protein ZNF470-DT isoform X2 n=1 Tax=Callithrix jacchus TaxID=9483 RepID=UPI0023DCF2AD|nr:uncharacterized protein ZNF470-DT isoform X2 [Callithrix jacchus]
MGPCPEFRPLQMGPTEDASAEAAAPGHLPRALGMCPHWALRSRYGRGRGQPPPGGLPALASLTPAHTAFSARPGRALGRRLAATHPAVTQRGHTAGPDYRARSLLLGASPHARHVRALTATRPHAHGHAHAHDRRPHRSRDTIPAAAAPARARFLLGTRRDSHSSGFGSSPEKRKEGSPCLHDHREKAM